MTCRQANTYPIGSRTAGHDATEPKAFDPDSGRSPPASRSPPWAPGFTGVAVSTRDPPHMELGESSTCDSVAGKHLIRGCRRRLLPQFGVNRSGSKPRSGRTRNWDWRRSLLARLFQLQARLRSVRLDLVHGVQHGFFDEGFAIGLEQLPDLPDQVRIRSVRVQSVTVALLKMSVPGSSPPALGPA